MNAQMLETDLFQVKEWLKKYKDNAAKKIVDILIDFVDFGMKEADIIKICKMLSLDEAVNCINKFYDYKNKIVDLLTYSAGLDEKTFLEVIKTIEKYEKEDIAEIVDILDEMLDRVLEISDTGVSEDRNLVIEASRAIRKYKNGYVGEISCWMKEILKEHEDNRSVIEAIRIFSLDEMVNTVNASAYDAYTNREIAAALAEVAVSLMDKDVITKCCETIKKCEKEVVNEIAYALGEIADSSRDKKAVIKAAEFLLRKEIKDIIKK
ncbi:MAG: hypothetical protein QXL86_03310, partial [Candidatus Aenigmatarchaeota archaeon]